MKSIADILAALKILQYSRLAAKPARSKRSVKCGLRFVESGDF